MIRRTALALFVTLIMVGLGRPADAVSLLWKFPTGHAIKSSPVAEGSLLYFTSYDRNVYAVDRHTGKKVWQFTTGNVIAASPLLNQGTLYIASTDHNVYAL